MWIITGCFICHKAKWFGYGMSDDNFLCIITILFAPVVFIWDVFNRVFIQKWHNDKTSRKLVPPHKEEPGKTYSLEALYSYWIEKIFEVEL